MRMIDLKRKGIRFDLKKHRLVMLPITNGFILWKVSKIVRVAMHRLHRNGRKVGTLLVAQVIDFLTCIRMLKKVARLSRGGAFREIFRKARLFVRHVMHPVLERGNRAWRISPKLAGSISSGCIVIFATRLPRLKKRVLVCRMVEIC